MAEDQVAKILVSSTYIKLKLEDQELMSMLGTGGKRIEAIQDDSGAYINTGVKSAQKEIKEVIVSGSPEAVASAQGIVREFLDSGRVIEVTERQARIIMGRGGWNIRELQVTTGTAITHTGAREFIIYGSEEAKEQALKRITTMVGVLGV